MALITKYRPQTFAEVVGQESAIKALKNIAKAPGVQVPSIFLYGSFGSGKSTLARLFSRAISCSEFPKTGEVCNKCDGCKEAMRQGSTTHIELDSTRVGTVEQIRNMDTLFSSAVKGRRVILFDESHTLSRAAQSALLKVLEEGVKDTFFIFASTNKVIETIISRSLVLEITTLPVNLIQERVLLVAKKEGIMLTEQQSRLIAIKSEGHMRNAMSILELFSLIGDDALSSAVIDLKRYVLSILKNQNVEDSLNNLLNYPILEIKTAVQVFLKEIFTAEDPFSDKLRKSGLHNLMFNFFYSPVAREALSDETGTEILLRTLADNLSK